MSDPNNMMAQLNQLLGQNNTLSFQMLGFQADFSSLGSYQPNNVNAFAGTGLWVMLKSLTNIPFFNCSIGKKRCFNFYRFH